MKRYFKKIDFEDHKVGIYNISDFVKDWASKPKRGVTEKRCEIVKIGGKKVLQITIPKNKISGGGSFWRLYLPKGLTEVIFEYDLMFGKNFNFVRGGKLPGLCGGTCPGRGSKDTNGFSARLMWRVATSYEELCHLVKNLRLANIRDVHKPYLVQYLYYPDKKTRKWGKDFIYLYKDKKIFL